MKRYLSAHRATSLNMLRAFILFPVLLMMISSIGHAQEFTLFPRYLKDSFPIIREVENDSVMVNTNYEVKTSFSLIDLSSTSFKEIYMGSGKNILDFEILEKEYVYYCGYYKQYVGNNNSFSTDNVDKDRPLYVNHAIVGYFPISYMFGSSWSSTTVQPIIDDFDSLQLKSLNRMELIPVEDGIHIIMTGTTSQGESCIVDIAGNGYSPTTWNIHYDISQRGDVFDDIAVTDNYYVVSYHNGNMGFLSYYDRPTSYSYSTLSSPLADYAISYNVDAKILMESYEVLDSFATLTYSNEENGIVVSRYDGFNPQYSVVINYPTNLSSTEQLYDIKYDRESYNVEVLQRIYEGSDSGSIIWHVTPMCFVGSPTILGHKYKEDKLHSIAIRYYNPWHTIATGHENGAYDALNKIYQIKQNQHGNKCVTKNSTSIVNLKHILTPEDRPVYYGFLTKVVSDVIWMDQYWPFDYPCDYFFE